MSFRKGGNMAADLHLHTTASDGKWTPEELITQVQKTNLTTIAITDHDTVDGVLPCIAAAMGSDLEIIPGIELNTEHNNRDVHILGYWIRLNNEQLIETLQYRREQRAERGKTIIERLNQLGINIGFDKVQELAGDGVIGRAHIARILLEEGYVESINEAFDKFLARNKPAFVPYQKLTPKEAIKLVLSAGGIPVIAHPGLMGDDNLIKELVEYGLAGIEAVYPSHSQEETNKYLRICEEYQLCPTGGSDCHGNIDKDHAALGSISIPAEWVAQLKARWLNS